MPLLPLMVLVASLSACSLVDADLSRCDTDYNIDYELRLVTNMTTELQARLSSDIEMSPTATALRDELKDIFSDHAHDVDLSFYDVKEDSARIHHEQHIMDATQSSYTLYIPVRRYMHVAVANINDNHEVFLEEDELCHKARLVQPRRDTVESHHTGIFTARLPMDIRQGVDQQFDVRLYMANCASALVLDTLGLRFKDIRVFASGFATGLNLADSTYRFDNTPVVRASQVEVDSEGAPLCFTTVTFPSRDVEDTKVIIETEDPFMSETAENPLWRYRVYFTLDDGSVTETILGVNLPLRAGQFKVIRARALPDGSVVPMDSYVGASVTLKWNERPGWEIEF